MYMWKEKVELNYYLFAGCHIKLHVFLELDNLWSVLAFIMSILHFVSEVWGIVCRVLKKGEIVLKMCVSF